MTCSICYQRYKPACLRKFVEHERGRHGFHKDCLSSWAQRSSRCPLLCGADITRDVAPTVPWHQHLFSKAIGFFKKRPAVTVLTNGVSLLFLSDPWMVGLKLLLSQTIGWVGLLRCVDEMEVETRNMMIAIGVGGIAETAGRLAAVLALIVPKDIIDIFLIGSIGTTAISMAAFAGSTGILAASKRENFLSTTIAVQGLIVASSLLNRGSLLATSAMMCASALSSLWTAKIIE